MLLGIHFTAKTDGMCNIDELRAKRASYEASATLSKDSRISQRWIEANIKPIIKSRSDKSQTKILSYLHDCGFNNDVLAKDMIESVMDAMERKKQRFGQRQKGSMPRNDIGQTTIPDSVSDKKNWGIDDSAPAPTTYDDVTSYLREVKHGCQYCHKENSVWLNIAVGDERKLEKVELAEIPKPSIEK